MTSKPIKDFFYPINIADLLLINADISNKEREQDFDTRKRMMEQEAIKEAKFMNKKDKDSEKFFEEDFEFQGENEDLPIPETNIEFRYKSQLKNPTNDHKALQIAGYGNIIEPMRDYYDIKKIPKPVEADSIEYLKIDYRADPILYKLTKEHKFQKSFPIMKNLYELSTSHTLPALEISKRGEIFAKLYMKYHYDESLYGPKYQEEENKKKRRDTNELAKNNLNHHSSFSGPISSSNNNAASKIHNSDNSKVPMSPRLGKNFDSATNLPILPPSLDSLLQGNGNNNFKKNTGFHKSFTIFNDKDEKFTLKGDNESDPSQNVSSDEEKRSDVLSISNYMKSSEISNDNTKGKIKKSILSTKEEKVTNISQITTSSLSGNLHKNQNKVENVLQLKEEIKKNYEDLMVKALKEYKVDQIVSYKQKIEELENLKITTPNEKVEAFKYLTNLKIELKKRESK